MGLTSEIIIALFAGLICGIAYYSRRCDQVANYNTL